ncbi:MAG: orotidine-5'-phosphate decarboxylase [Elusimicrobia bacterium]|nr:orotidine-5'-phosphate decarboxylase [Elusimicrobiota bacterium]
MTKSKEKNPLIVALDVEKSRALELAAQLQSMVFAFKIGSFLYTAAGPELVRSIQGQGGLVFLDLKWHDIPHVVSEAVREAVRLGVWGLTVHCSGGFAMLRECRLAAQKEAESSGRQRPRLFGVTVLTSLKERDLYRMGLNRTVESQVKRLATLAMDAELDGVVCSGQEVEVVRKACGSDFLVVVPGILPPQKADGAYDQKRAVSLQEALQRGADYVVLGRSVLCAEDPVRALKDPLRALEACHGSA